MEAIGGSLGRAIGEAFAASEEFYDEAAVAREAALDAARHRRACLDEAAPDITAEDFARLVRDVADPSMALRTVRKWWEKVHDPAGGFPFRVLVLVGGTGCGKTVAGSWALARERGRCVTVERLLLIARSRSPLHLAEIDAVARAKLLLLDEAGAEHDPIAARAVVLELLNRRQRGQLTILTSNLDEPGFRSWLDERALSRVMQIGKIVTCTGPDLRLVSSR